MRNIRRTRRNACATLRNRHPWICDRTYNTGMRRIDRAIFAIFLLALVADVARSYASTPVSSDLSGSLILNAASQLQSSSPAKALPTHRRGSYASPYAKRTPYRPVLAAWSKALFRPPMQWSQVALLQPAAVVAIMAPYSAYRPERQQHIPFLSLDRIEHAGNPAP